MLKNRMVLTFAFLNIATTLSHSQVKAIFVGNIHQTDRKRLSGEGIRERTWVHL